MNPAKVNHASEGDKLVSMINNLITWRVLKKVTVCPSCKKAAVMLQTRQRSKDSGTSTWTYRCSKCTKYHSAFESSFFSLFRKPIDQILLVIKLWSAGTINRTCLFSSCKARSPSQKTKTMIT